MEFYSIPLNFLINSINFLHHFFSKFSYVCSHPLFLSIVALYTLILLYFPSCFLRIVLSPVLNTTVIILISLLQLGVKERSGKESNIQKSRILDSSANEKLEKEPSFVHESSSMEQRCLDYTCKNQTHVEFKAKMDLDLESNESHADSKPICGLELDYNQMHTKFKHDLGSKCNMSEDDYYKWELLDTNSMESSQVVNEGVSKIELGSKQVDTKMKILEWNMKAPLEIIYEAYEGEEEEEESNENNVVTSNKQDVGCDKFPFLLMYYPESESDSSSDGDFPMKEKWETYESVFLKWEEEDDDREELIEISLDRYGKRSFDFCHAEEDNLIEIDIFPTRN